MDFDSDEQRKAVFANIRYREGYRYRYRGLNTSSNIQSLDLQIKNLRYVRDELKRKIDVGER